MFGLNIETHFVIKHHHHELRTYKLTKSSYLNVCVQEKLDSRARTTKQVLNITNSRMNVFGRYTSRLVRKKPESWTVGSVRARTHTQGGEGEGRGRKWGVAVWKDRGTMKSEQSHYSSGEKRGEERTRRDLPRAISEQKEAKAVSLSTPECSRAAISLHHYHN